jgi:hypothetical protein
MKQDFIITSYLLNKLLTFSCFSLTEKRLTVQVVGNKSFGLSFPITDVEPKTHYCGKKEYAQCGCIYQLFIKILPGYMEQQKMNIRIGAVMITQSFSYLPVPVCTKTITPPIPDTQYEPGKGRKQYG